jgi:hypothetical protein
MIGIKACLLPGKIKTAATWPIKFTNNVKSGKALKHKREESVLKDYEEKRNRLFLPVWQTGRLWLQFDSDI